MFAGAEAYFNSKVSYNWGTGKYENANGSIVDFGTVFTNIIVPNSENYSIANDQDFRDLNITIVSAFGKNTVLTSDGPIGDLIIGTNGALRFSNNTAGINLPWNASSSSSGGEGFDLSYKQQTDPVTLHSFIGDLTMTSYSSTGSDRNGPRLNYVNNQLTGLSYKLGPVSTGINSKGISGSIKTNNASLSYNPNTSSITFGIFSKYGTLETGYEFSFQPNNNTILFGLLVINPSSLVNYIKYALAF